MGTTLLWGRASFLHLLPPPPPSPPPAGGLARWTEPPVPTFRCLLAASSLCAKMLVPRAARFRPALATAPARLPDSARRRRRPRGCAAGTGLGAARLARQGAQPRAPVRPVQAWARPAARVTPGDAQPGASLLGLQGLPAGGGGHAGPSPLLPGVSPRSTWRTQESIPFTSKYSYSKV